MFIAEHGTIQMVWWQRQKCACRSNFTVWLSGLFFSISYYQKGSLELLPIISEYAVSHIKLGTKVIAFQILSLLSWPRHLAFIGIIRNLWLSPIVSERKYQLFSYGGALLEGSALLDTAHLLIDVSDIIKQKVYPVTLSPFHCEVLRFKIRMPLPKSFFLNASSIFCL